MQNSKNEREKGAVDHITEPIFTEELLFRIRKIFREKEYEKTMREAQRYRPLRLPEIIA